MYEEYRQRCHKGEFILGDVFTWQAQDVIIFNLGTQKTWKAKADLSAIEKSITTMVKIASKMGIKKIGLPRIGAGLGGLNWNDVKHTIII